MKRLLIILALIPLFGYGQINDNIFTSSGGGLIFNGELLYVNTLSLGARLSLLAQNISEDSLTFNSSADLVTYANSDTVVLDGGTSVVIGNSARFGTPTAGTFYQILDTLGSSDTLILDQSFTGSVTDEFFWGGVNTWYDESGKGNHLYQTVAVYQPKLLWAGTDSAEVAFDGVNDRLQAATSDVLDYTTNDFSFYMKLRMYGSTSSRYLLSKGGGGAVGYAFYATSTSFLTMDIKDSDTRSIPSLRVDDFLFENVVLNFDRNSDGTVIIDDDSNSSTIANSEGSIANSNKLTLGAFFTGTLNRKMEVRKVLGYSRILSSSEINILLQ